ncbi:hypothetical protein KI387_044056 [Taxus chinensis]|uniref:Uncharacterized protein n=1 Tax=Taxus chinensis TaxID=29808 RepID=A0AA38FZT2_TAXCH|nr:hypothetical protein KI387_044056 [Taxus chinensis]
MIKSLVNLALRSGIEKIPLLVKPTEEVKVEEKVVVRTDFVAVEEQKEEIEEFELKNFVLEEEFNQDQDFLQAVEKGEASPNPKEEDHILAVGEKSAYPKALSTKQSIEEPSVLLSTSSLSISSVEEEFDLSKSMLEDERNHGDQVADQ